MPVDADGLGGTSVVRLSAGGASATAPAIPAGGAPVAAPTAAAASAPPAPLHPLASLDPPDRPLGRLIDRLPFPLANILLLLRIRPYVFKLCG